MDNEESKPRVFQTVVDELTEEDRVLILERIGAQKQIIDKAVQDNKMLLKCLEDVYSNVNLMKSNVDRIILPLAKQG